MTSKPTPPPEDASQTKAAGRIVHDERGNAIWDWVKDTARTAIDSTSRLLMRLDVPELTMEDSQEQELRRESERDPGGGYDPYGGSGSTSSRTAGTRETRGASGGYDPHRSSNATSARTGGARGVGNSDPPRAPTNSAGSRHGTFGNVSTTGGARSSTSNNADGGYDPYGKEATTKPSRKP